MKHKGFEPLYRGLFFRLKIKATRSVQVELMLLCGRMLAYYTTTPLLESTGLEPVSRTHIVGVTSPSVSSFRIVGVLDFCNASLFEDPCLLH